MKETGFVFAVIAGATLVATGVVFLIAKARGVI